MDSLRKHLQFNGGFSTISGLVMLLGSNWLASILGIGENIILLVIGAGLVVFGVFVFFVSIKHADDRTLIHVITILDILWVLGSLTLLVFKPFTLSTTGYQIIAGVMVLITFFAYQQYRYNK